MARSKPRFRAAKLTGSCPCVPDNDKEMKELASKLAQEEPRFCINDIYNYNINTIPSDEYVDLESYSEVSSFGIHIENLEPDVFPTDVPSMGDQMEEYHSGGNMSSGRPEDSEPNEGSSSFEIRKLNIAETVMSWLDNYGQARGYTLGSHGTSLIINPDDVSRLDSGSADADEVISSSKSKPREVTTRSSVSAKTSKGSEIMESACRIIFNFHNDLEPLKKANTHGIKWEKVQQVLSIWTNLMSTIWERSREENIHRSELYGSKKFGQDSGVP
ncbi:unnamed protein product [Allacma fusca]|uniref:Uncharacterized protein n=1 Tax=Allacma fusca TaxID=39272 RepID=A0A8J2LJL6_9HEXA|nr:unnamed protein product [Allacma fusca]